MAGLTVNEAVTLDVSERTVRLGSGVVTTVSLEVPHCKVMGVIKATSNFELRMPDAWSEKFLMGGGYGFVGSLQNAAHDGFIAIKAIERGYATVGTDTATPVAAAIRHCG